MSIESTIAEAESAVERKDLHQALDLFLRARDEAFHSGDTMSYVRCCQAAAVVYDNLGRYAEAVASLDRGITASSLLDVVSSSGLRINKGVCLLKMKEWGLALREFKEASSTLRKVPPLVRTQEIHELIDMAETNAWGVEDILNLIALGTTVTVNDEV